MGHPLHDLDLALGVEVVSWLEAVLLDELEGDFGAVDAAAPHLDGGEVPGAQDRQDVVAMIERLELARLGWAYFDIGDAEGERKLREVSAVDLLMLGQEDDIAVSQLHGTLRDGRVLVDVRAVQPRAVRGEPDLAYDLWSIRPTRNSVFLETASFS